MQQGIGSAYGEMNTNVYMKKGEVDLNNQAKMMAGLGTSMS